MSDAAEYLSSLPPWRLGKASILMEYMLSVGSKADDPDIVITEMARRIRDAGVPLDRASSIVPLRHAEAVASARYWDIDKGATHRTFPVSPSSGQGYARSPAAVVHDTRDWLILRLSDVSDDLFEIVPELKADGYTHYIMAPVFMRFDMAATFSFATRAPAGFSDEDIAFLRAVFPALAATQEILATRRVMAELMRMYVGEEPMKRILTGDVHRGEVMRMEAAILFADMRRFTELTADMEAAEATAFLNTYYDCIVPKVEAEGGEVLKFMADGILAVFREDGTAGETCARALRAAQAGLAAVECAQSDPPFEVGIALHYGEVAYGNVGSGMRQDYTVIGRDVNLASRVAGLCGSLSQPLLVTRDVVAQCGGLDAFQSAGLHRVKGLAHPQEVYLPM